MRFPAFAVALGATLSASLAHADMQDSGNSLCFMATAASDYRFRGISQTRLEPALQGGADYANRPTGLYAGTWLSTIKWIKDMGGDANVEWDVYGGKKGKLGGEVAYDVGAISYVFPRNRMDATMGGANANTTEIYGQLGLGPAYVKYSHAVTDAFGVADSKGSGYLDVGADIPVGSRFTVNLHAGHQTFRHHGALSYSDWKLGVTANIRGFSLGVAAVGTDTENYMGPAPAMKNLGKRGVVVSLTKMFM